jgi:dihydrofolate reductase
LATALFAEIDEIIVKRNPVLFGEGIPMFVRAVAPTALDLSDHKADRNGFMLLRYRVKRAES